jgi:hypothetical protein
MINLKVCHEAEGVNYEGQAAICTDYLPKLNSWINKKRFKCTKTADEKGVDLNVGNMFEFDLKKVETNQIDLVKEQMD